MYEMQVTNHCRLFSAINVRSILGGRSASHPRAYVGYLLRYSILN